MRGDMRNARRILRDVLEGKNPEQLERREKNRTTVMLRARVRPEIEERARREAGHWGLNMSEYITHLVTGQDPLPKLPGDAISAALIYHLAGSKVMQAIVAVEARIAAGEDLAGVRAELQEIRRAIVAGELASQTKYEAEIAASGHAPHEWGDA